MGQCFCCLMNMKTRKPSNTEDEKKLPFSFKKTDLTAKKIEDHWQKIADKIAEQNKESAQDQGGAEQEPNDTGRP